MKVLYASYRYDPRELDMGSSVDYERYNAILSAGFDLDIVGPVTSSLSLVERSEYWLWREYSRITKKNSLKFPISLALKSSRMLEHSIDVYKPDVIFSIFPTFFVFYTGRIPFIWELDTTFIGLQAHWPLYGKLPFSISVWQEKRALSKAARVITMSQWSKNLLINQYGVIKKRIEIIPMPASIPSRVIPTFVDIRDEKRLETPFRVLLVGRVFARKGIDIAIEVVNDLNQRGFPAILTICGIKEAPANIPEFVHFVGSYQKSDPEQLLKYVSWYRWAHILIHPARFEAAGIVPSEAAAFGTPTITNDTGGLATTVKHGESGIVLPRNSPPKAYVEAICNLISQPERYYELCETTRQRYERELNSEVAGRQLVKILQEVVDEHRERKS